MTRGLPGVVALLLGCQFIAGCSLFGVRHELNQDFDGPEARLRAAAHPVTVALQNEWAPHDLRVPIDVDAPHDSAVVLVLKDNVSTDVVRNLLGESAKSLEWEWQRRQETNVLRPLVSYSELDPPGRPVLGSLAVAEVSTPSRGPLHVMFDVRKPLPIPANAEVMVVRPGDQIRIIAKASIIPPGFDDQGKYRVHYEWITIPTDDNSLLRCGSFGPHVAESSPPVGNCTGHSGYAALRELNARTKMISVSVSYVGGVILGLGTAIWAISRF